MAGVALSVPQARFAWQAWYFLCHHRCQRKLGDEVGLWRRGLLRGRRGWHFRHLRLDLRGRRGTFATSIDVRGSSATNWVGLTPLHFTMYVCTYVGRYVCIGRYVGT